MASGGNKQHTRDLSETSETTLLHLLSITLILRHIVPYLPPSALLSIAATSKVLRDHLHSMPGAFRYLDLSSVKSAQFNIAPIDNGGEVWRNEQVDENLTEDDFYSGPLRCIFGNVRRRNILQDVQTLVLDGLSVTSELVNDILVDPSFNVRILSIREAKNLNERKLMQTLKYACRKSRAEDTLRLKGLYVFGKRDSAPALPSTSSSRESSAGSSPLLRTAEFATNWNHNSSDTLQRTLAYDEDDWYHKKGRIISKPISEGWAETLLDCRESIRFDAVLCTGPRHPNSPAYGQVPVSAIPGGDKGHAWNVATFAMGGCASCGCAPEGLTVHGSSAAEGLPLLAPIPLHASTIKAATIPMSSNFEFNSEEERPGFAPRCYDCIRERYCFACKQWWCEACYRVPTNQEVQMMNHVHIVDGEDVGVSDYEAAAVPLKLQGRKITRSCWECENNCLDCIAHTQRHCKVCGGGYCIVHYDGSTMTLCDWCSTRGRRIRELY